MAVNGEELGKARRPAGGDDKRQPQSRNLLVVGKQALPNDSHASRVDIMAMLPKSGLGDAVLQQNDRPGAIYDDGAATAKLVKRSGIECLDVCGGHPAPKFRGDRLQFGGVPPADEKLAVTGLQKLGDDSSSRCAVAANNAESALLSGQGLALRSPARKVICFLKDSTRPRYHN